MKDKLLGISIADFAIATYAFVTLDSDGVFGR